MPDWFWEIMLFVFAIHCLIFTILAMKRRRLASALAAGAFFLLFIAISIRVWLPESRIMGISTSWYFRIPAWILAISGISIGYRQRRERKKAVIIESNNPAKSLKAHDISHQP